MPLVMLISCKNIKKNITFYLILMLGIELILMVTFLSLLLLPFFFSFELMLTLISLSVSQWGSKLYKIRSSFYLLLFTIFGSLFLFIAIVILYVITGSTNFILLENFQSSLNQQCSITLLFICGFGIWCLKCNGNLEFVRVLSNISLTHE